MPTLRPPGSKRAFCIFFSGRVFLSALIFRDQIASKAAAGAAIRSPDSVGAYALLRQSFIRQLAVDGGAGGAPGISHPSRWLPGRRWPGAQKGRSDRTSALRPFFIRRYSASSDKPKRFKSCSVSTRTPLCISSAAVTPEPGVRTPAKAPSYT